MPESRGLSLSACENSDQVCVDAEVGLGVCSSHMLRRYFFLLGAAYVFSGGDVGGALAIKKGRGVLLGARDPYPFPDSLTKVRRTYTPL